MRDIHSAQNYVDWGFYFLISSALQRRVWLSGSETSIFPNLYCVFTGTPGTGKSLVSNTIKTLLGEHVRTVGDRSKGDRIVQVPIFPMSADSTSFEALVEATFNANQIHQVDEKNKYFSQPICIILDELASIFKVNAEDTATFLLTCFSGTRYSRVTRHKGSFQLPRPLIGMLAATVTDALRDMIRRRILDSGIGARTIFIHAREPRFRQMLIPPRSPEQEEDKQLLQAHIRNLAGVYGQMAYTPEALDYLNGWWKDRRRVIINPASCLESYYERKSLHVNKMSMIVHFMEQHESMEIELSSVLRAIEILNKIETIMSIPLSGGGRNEAYTIALDILDYLRSKGPTPELEIVMHFLPAATGEEIQDCLLILQNQQKVARKVIDNKVMYEEL